MMRLCFSLLLVAFSFSLLAAPAQVIIIRHAEKPPAGNVLSLQGEQRAAALVPFFTGNPLVLAYGTPVAIYAAGQKSSSSSIRAIQTVTPLAEELHLTINHNFDVPSYGEMVAEIMNAPAYSGKMVLICWEHSKIPDIAKALGVHHPPKWHGKAYDRFWVITFLPQGGVSFQDLPQQLMFGDSTK